uniref:Uncharacterized protein n=1 Tax=Arundo donax TaxID=35708 RepID=A0A0A9FYY4_ARUDO
MSSVTRGRW